MKRILVKTSIGAVGLVTLLLVPVQGCTDLGETPISSITPSHFFQTEGEVLAALAGVYAGLRNTAGDGDYWGVSEVSSDEMVVPTRGSDWFDNGTWLELHRQTWSANSPATLTFLNNAWNTAYAGVARANVLLDALQKVTVPNEARIEGEVRFLRAFYYYLLMDLFGGVPIATTLELQARARATRDSTFRFIESELLAARPALPLTWDASNRGRITRGAADALLANMYLNARVFKNEGAGAGGINATGYNSCLGVTVSGPLDACQAAINRADSIINSAVYQLADTFVQNFNADNHLSKENIFVVKFADADGLGFNMLMRTLHYNQFSPSPWNGFAALAQTYNAFDPADKRREVLLVGPQLNVESGLPAKDRAGAALVFTTTIANVTSATEGEGPRIYKWPVDPKHVQENNGNDYAWFRLAEIYLIKAEALNEQTPGSAGALDTLNRVRARTVPVAAARPGPITRDMVLSERLFEFMAEGKRRQDLIRHGRYTLAWEHKPGPIAASRVLMPIPQTQVDANALIDQNDGY
jgi:starch-binding outer membrane protein, SusD/RagB family